MNEINKYEENGWTLTHSWYLDDLGLKRNSFELSRIRDDGTKFNFPFMGKIRVNNFTREIPIDGDDTSPYESFEYSDMLREQAAKITWPPKL